MDYFVDKTFEASDTQLTSIIKGEYEHCIFKNIDFSNFNFSGFRFIDCGFKDSNLSLVKLGETAFVDCTFEACKMLGLHFEHCQAFGLAVRFTNCLLDHTSFYQTALKKTRFIQCRLHGADFTETNLTEAVFDQCDLLGARFDNTILEKANFTTAFNYIINPSVNRIKKARFSADGIAGLLAQYDIIIE